MNPRIRNLRKLADKAAHKRLFVVFIDELKNFDWKKVGL